MSRRFPPPWSAEETETCFIVRDANGQALAYVYFEEEPGRRSAAHLLTRDEDSPTWVVVQFDQARSGTEKSGNSRMSTFFSESDT